MLVDSPKNVLKTLLLCIATLPLAPVLAQDAPEKEYLAVSPYTFHYSRSGTHKPVWLLGMEQVSPNNSLRGAAFFSNSFGQESVYFFPWGGRYDQVLGANWLYAKWSAGILYGYKPPYDKKVPMNYKGFSPAIVPTIGLQASERWALELQFLGNSALMFSTVYRYK